MVSPHRPLAALQAAARQNTAWNWYAIADSAQQRSLPAALVDDGCQVRCLLGAAQDSPVARTAPHLVALASPLDGGAAWNWISLHAPSTPCVTVLASTVSFAAMFEHLVGLTEAMLPDGETMFFGFWDPAILGTLLGQADDPTLHVAGPVLDPEQCSFVLAPMAAWWYWDRDGGFHQVAIPADAGLARLAWPLTLSQAQVDALVEASVPDHVLYFLALNQPLLLEPIPQSERYRFVSNALSDAHAHGLVAMQDMVNFVCAALIYDERFGSDPRILALLAEVKQGTLAFAEALAQMP